jgi:[acyl-carrier-protein] S-malonyltransferase
MGRGWFDAGEPAQAVYAEADDVLGDSLGLPLSTLSFEGPEDRLTRTDAAQPAIYACSVACFRALQERDGPMSLAGTAGLSLGEYTALHLAGVFSFADGLRLVALRGRLMQEASDAADSSMVALTGADEAQADEVCEKAADGEVLVPANFNSPGQVVLSGHTTACQRAAQVAESMGLRATPLTVAGAFHSPLMQSAADAMAEALSEVPFQSPNIPVWSNVTAEPHAEEVELIRRRLVEQIVSPVKWAQGCLGMPAGDTIDYRELAPGTVLRGLMRRIERSRKVISHDQP